MPKRLVILWNYYQHYHHARLRALQLAGRDRGWVVTGLAAGQRGAVHESHTIAEATAASGLIDLGGSDGDINSPEVARELCATLDHLDPAAVLVPGYGFRVSRHGLRWCRKNRRGAVMMFESQERDQRRLWFKELWKRWLMRSADCAFCGGSHHAAYAARLGLPVKRIFQGYSAVDNDFWRSQTDAARRRPALLGQPYFLAVGRFIPKKNFVGLVAAFAEFKRQDRAGWCLVIVGDGPERGAIERAVGTADLRAWVSFPGYVDANATATWLAGADVFVMPSTGGEQWGLVVNEAMASSVPVIASSACGCVPDLVQDGRTGLVFDSLQPDQLVAAMHQLAASPELRREFATTGQRHIQGFSLERFAREALAAAEMACTVADARFSFRSRRLPERDRTAAAS